MDFSFYDSNGELFDFCGLDHSLTLAIFEKINEK